MDICKLRARSGSKDQLVAVKRLRPSAQIDLSQLANEGKILRTLRHRCVAALCSQVRLHTCAHDAAMHCC